MHKIAIELQINTIFINELAFCLDMESDIENDSILKKQEQATIQLKGKLDTDGILIIHEWDTTKFSFNIGGKNISRSITNFVHDCKDDKATRKTDGGLIYWNMICREGRFAGTGKKNWTARPEIQNGNVTNTISGVANAKRQGYIGRQNDLRDQEFTVIGRVKGIKDDNETWSLKVRGDGHEDNKVEKTLCCSFGYPYKKRKSDLYGAELSHPSTAHRQVTFMTPQYPLLKENWIGIKGIIYNINDNKAIHAECWVDDNPIERDERGQATGKFMNNWNLIWAYEEQRNDTVVWAGPSNQMRVDMCKELEIAALNVRSIRAPNTQPTRGIPLNTNEIDDYIIDENDLTKPTTSESSNENVKA
jgi:hypothetical protein